MRALTAATILACVLATGGCVSRPPVPADPDLLLVKPDVALEDDGTPMPFVTFLASYHGLTLDAERTASARKVFGEGRSASPDELQRALEAAGMRVWVMSGEDEPTSGRSITHHLKEGRPMLTMTRSADDAGQWSLLVGTHADPALWIAVEPGQGLISLEATGFQADWERANRCMILALNPAAVVP